MFLKLSSKSFVFQSLVSSFRTGHHAVLCSTYASWSGKDYQYLQRSRVPTMHFQKSLPRLPIPELEKTCQRYLRALEPITPPDKLAVTRSLVEKFQKGEGKALHEELKEIDKNNKQTSYISGPWFDMYLRSRVPLVLNYNPFLAFKDDPIKEYNNQLFRATNMLISALRFRKSLKEHLLEPEVYHLNPSKSDTQLFRSTVRLFPESLSWYAAYMFKAFPLDMSQFRNLFNSTRIPQIGKDQIQDFPEARHILVMRNGRLYVFDVYDSDGNITPPAHIYTFLAHILNEKSAIPSHPISFLTTEERDTWAQTRQQLEQLGNSESLRLIDSALFALVLDEESLQNDLLKSAHHMLHGPAHNRWFDKCFQLIISKDGKAAINFEHSWGDGVAVLRFFNEVFKDSTTNHFVGPDTMLANVDASHLVHKLEFKLDEAIKSAVRNARERHKLVVNSLKFDVLQYDRLNRDVIKNFKLSPDALAQLGFQMAFYKLYSKFVATYESCSTSAFKHGRTETVRPVTSETKALVEMLHRSPKPSPNEVKGRLQECTKIHNQLTKEAAMGQGFDRHLFAMKYIAEKKSEKLPELFSDPAYAEANHYILSSSTLFGPAFSGGGFGPVVQDGFGIAYGFIGNMMGCLVSTYPAYQNGSSFMDALRASYDELHENLQKANVKST